MDPLNPNGELKEEGTEEEGEDVFEFTVGEGEHDETEGVADEHSQEVFEGFDVLACGF